ncbi:MAG: RNA polymerase factor sigma-54 [Saprospiraceae bacterium]|nr:RNA polymerase factor sigma-54 [Saprospiraceae bacterium]
MIKQQLSQKLLQKLSPQQIQLMKLLQIPTASLDQRIKEELEANPALEEGAEEDEMDFNEDQEDDAPTDNDEESFGDDEDTRDPDDGFDLDDYINEYIEDDPGSYNAMDNNKYEEEQQQVPMVMENSFHEYLERQIGLFNIKDERSIAILEQLIGSIDEDGYLRRDPLAVIDDLMFSKSMIVEPHEVMEMLKFVHKLEPAGVGARDLQECLLLQLNTKINQDQTEATEDPEILQKACSIIRDHFDEFSKKHFAKLMRQLEMDEEELREVIEVIIKLNPKPASGYASGGSDGSNYVIPDFIIQNRDGELELTLNSRNAPELRVSDHYRDMLRSYSRNREEGNRMSRKEREAVLFIKQKIDSARWFIDAIQKRQSTMYKTMYAIMQFQYEFFVTGDTRKLKPMILKDIADVTGLDISTVSRVANSKFVQTEFGTKRLKEFFSESLQTQDGDEVSTTEVKKILSDIISEEDKQKPLSDEDLKEMLQEKGYTIARRTVAKYREQLGVSVARLRKEL